MSYFALDCFVHVKMGERSDGGGGDGLGGTEGVKEARVVSAAAAAEVVEVVETRGAGGGGGGHVFRRSTHRSGFPETGLVTAEF